MIRDAFLEDTGALFHDDELKRTLEKCTTQAFHIYMHFTFPLPGIPLICRFVDRGSLIYGMLKAVVTLRFWPAVEVRTLLIPFVPCEVSSS